MEKLRGAGLSFFTGNSVHQVSRLRAVLVWAHLQERRPQYLITSLLFRGGRSRVAFKDIYNLQLPNVPRAGRQSWLMMTVKNTFIHAENCRSRRAHIILLTILWQIGKLQATCAFFKHPVIGLLFTTNFRHKYYIIFYKIPPYCVQDIILKKHNKDIN